MTASILPTSGAQEPVRHNIGDVVSKARVAPLAAVSAAQSQVTDTPRTIVITTCSSGKRIRGSAVAEAIRSASQTEVAAQWLGLLRRAQPTAAARDLYKGRAFSVTKSAAAHLRADLGVLSAGLGFVRGDVEIPGYDLTMRPRCPGSVADRIVGDVDAATWWRSASAGPYASDLPAAASEYDLVLVAISRAYLAMVINDLLTIERERPGRVRLFGLSLDAYVPEALIPAIMPYDARLDSIGNPGTRSDFAARALDDFVRHVGHVGGDAASHAAFVRTRMAAGTLPPTRIQRRVDDDVVGAAVREFIKGGGRGGARALAWLRNHRGISCEQRRFAGIYRVVAEQTA